MRRIVESRVLRNGETFLFYKGKANRVRISCFYPSNSYTPTLGECAISFHSTSFSGDFKDAFACSSMFMAKSLKNYDYLSGYDQALSNYRVHFNGSYKYYDCEIGFAEFERFEVRVNKLGGNNENRWFKDLKFDFIYDDSIIFPRYQVYGSVEPKCVNEFVFDEVCDSLVVFDFLGANPFYNVPCLVTDNGDFDCFNQLSNLADYHNNDFASVYSVWNNIYIPDTKKFTLQYSDAFGTKTGRIYRFI